MKSPFGPEKQKLVNEFYRQHGQQILQTLAEDFSAASAIVSRLQRDTPPGQHNQRSVISQVGHVMGNMLDGMRLCLTAGELDAALLTFEGSLDRMEAKEAVVQEKIQELIDREELFVEPSFIIRDIGERVREQIKEVHIIAYDLGYRPSPP